MLGALRPSYQIGGWASHPSTLFIVTACVPVWKLYVCVLAWETAVPGTSVSGLPGMQSTLPRVWILEMREMQTATNVVPPFLLSWSRLALWGPDDNVVQADHMATTY